MNEKIVTSDAEVDCQNAKSICIDSDSPNKLPKLSELKGSKRLEGESFQDFKQRRYLENKAVRNYLKRRG